MKRMRIIAIHTFLMSISIRIVSAELLSLQPVPPESVGLSSERLDRINSTLQDYVDDDKLAGALALVSRRGKVAYCETFGYIDLEAQRPMAVDAIFRIASMTKAVTAVAVLQLFEQGHFQLDDPVSKCIPAFKDVSVADPNSHQTDSQPVATVPMKRQVSIRDLLRHTSGFQYGGKRYEEAGLGHWDKSLKEFVETIATIPLATQPGTQFQYGYSTDVLGYLVELISGQSLDIYFNEHIFTPLTMTDTGFVVPTEKINRLTNHYIYRNNKLVCKEQAENSPFLKRAKALSGGGGWSYSYPGLVTTALDWLRFMEMLRNKGRLEGIRILSRKTVELMCSDHLGSIPGHYESGTGHGLAVGIVTDPVRHGQLADKGTIYWAGAPHNTYYFINFKEQMCGLLFMQNAPWGHLTLMPRFLVLAHQAIND